MGDGCTYILFFVYIFFSEGGKEGREGATGRKNVRKGENEAREEGEREREGRTHLHHSYKNREKARETDNKRGREGEGEEGEGVVTGERGVPGSGSGGFSYGCQRGTQVRRCLH